MTRVCYNRPNRTRQRHFTKKDVARICRAAIDKNPNITQQQIVAAAIVGADVLGKFEYVYRIVYVVKTISGLMLGLVLGKRISLIYKAVKLFLEEFSDRLGQVLGREPIFRRSISLLEPFKVATLALVAALGGIFGLLRWGLSADLSFLDEVRSEAYAFYTDDGHVPPDSELSDLVNQVLEGADPND